MTKRITRRAQAKALLASADNFIVISHPIDTDRTIVGFIIENGRKPRNILLGKAFEALVEIAEKALNPHS